MTSADRYAHLKRKGQQHWKSFPQTWDCDRQVKNPDAITFEQSLKERGLRYEVQFLYCNVGFKWFTD